jgi:HK97 family phage major capsid protein
VDYTLLSGTTFKDITFDDLILAPEVALNGGLETSAFYMHRSIRAQLMLKKGTDGHYLDYAMEFARQGTVLGNRVLNAEILPRNTQATQANKYFGIYGDIGQSVMFGQRRDFDVRSSTEHNFPADVTTLYASERIAVGSDEQCAKNLVKLKTNA